MPEEIDQLQSLIESLTAKLIDNAPQIIAAAVILVLGLLVGSSISKLILGIACINTAISNTEGIDAGKAPQVGIEAFGDSSINIGYRYWVKTNDYYAIQYKVNLEVFKALKQAQISIPFPQRDIHIVSNPNQNFPSKAS